MAEDERATGTSDTIYNLSSVLFHALEGGASYDTYIEDAEREGDEDLIDFFRQVREEDRDRAAEARLLITERTPPTTRTEGTASGTRAGLDLSTDLPSTEPVAEGVTSGDVRRETSVTGTPDQALVLPGEEAPPDLSRPGDAPPGETEGVLSGEEGSVREEDKGLVEKAKDYLRGEGRERDYPGSR